MQGGEKVPDATDTSPLSFPIFQAKSRDPRELARFVRHQYRVVRAGRRGDEDVVGSDGLALRREVGADLGRFLSTSVIEGEALKWLKKVAQCR
jgi:hypothetical protein